MKTLTAAIPTNLKLVLLAFYAAGMLPCAKADSGDRVRPNIILTVADDMGWAAPSCYGHPFSNTVNIDAMAANGVRFTRFYASFPQCTPTRASILTGRDPGRTHCIGAGSTMPTEERTVAEILKTEGYVTAHIGKWHLGGMLYGDASTQSFYKNKYRNLLLARWPHPRNQGFDDSYSIGNYVDNFRTTWKGKPNTGPIGSDDLGGWMLQENGVPVSGEGKPAFTSGDSSIHLADQAIKLIRQAHQDGKPFFLCLWFGSPHGPYVSLPEYEKPFIMHSPDHAAYWGEIKGMDVAIGKLRAELSKLGIADNTLHWFTADNGNFNFDGEHCGLSGGKGELSEGGIRVSSIVEYPKHFKPTVTDSLSSTVDMTPTLCDVLDIPLPGDRVYDGESLLPQMIGGKSTRHKPLFFAFRHPDGKPYAFSLIDGDWKLVWGSPRLEDRSQNPLNEASDLSLYHLKNDPGEKINLSNEPTSAPRIAAMKKALLEMDASIQIDFKAHADRWDANKFPN